MIEPRPGVIRAIPGDVRPLTPAEQKARSRAGRSAARAGYRPYRNGLPETAAYAWRQRSYPWAQQALAAAEAEHGTPRPAGTPGRPGRPGSRPAAPVAAAPPAPAVPAGPCRRCGYLTTALGHRIECGHA